MKEYPVGSMGWMDEHRTEFPQQPEPGVEEEPEHKSITEEDLSSYE